MISCYSVNLFVTVALEKLREIYKLLCHRDRPASYPTALSQIPACGFPAQGSSVLFASYKRKGYFQYPIIRGRGTLK